MSDAIRPELMVVEENKSGANNELATAYLDVVEHALTFSLYAETDGRIVHRPFGKLSGRVDLRRLRLELRSWVLMSALRILDRRDLRVVRVRSQNPEVREAGHDWPVFAQTMVGRRRLAHLRGCIEQVIADEIPGDLIEAGVWRGGASILMRAVLKAYGCTDRAVVLADSFAGLPEPGADADPHDRWMRWNVHTELAVSEEEVRGNFERYGLLDDQVRFVRGWFRDTMPALAGGSWSLIRLDGDTYEATTDCLTALYPGLAPGGFLIVDDYAVPSCRRAVEDFRKQNQVHEPIQQIDWTGVCWRRARRERATRGDA